MSWPTRTWTIDGWKDFNRPGSDNPEGFPEDWRDHRSGAIGDSITYWDILDNPLYESAASASGIDWNTWVSESMADIGSREDYDIPDPGPRYIRVRHGRGGNETSLIPYDPSGGAQHEMAARQNRFLNADGTRWSGDEEAWGISRNNHGNFIEDLDTMQSWIRQTLKTHSLQDMPIIDRGPQGSDYGIDGDIWVHYGLDKPVVPPKEMAVNYNFNWAELKPSNASYHTPEGYPKLDTSTEGVAYKDTHYARWQQQQRQENIAAQNAYDNTSYGEVQT